MIGLGTTKKSNGMIMSVCFNTDFYVVLSNFDLTLSALELRDFISQARWQDEGGRPFTRVSKQNILAKMNSSEFTRTGVTYCLSSDMFELWYGKSQPFQEFGHWIVIPGVHRKFIKLEMI